jgi:DNA-binding IclR family transcriptional regulator
MSGRSLGRGVLDGAFAVLGVLEASDAPLRSAEITRATGIPKQTVSRLLTQLEVHGAVARVDEGFTVGSGLFRFGSSWPGAQLAAVGQPVLAELQRRTGATVHLAVLVNDAVCYIAKLVGRDGDVAPSQVGRLQPPAGSAVGRVLLAGLPWEQRRRVLGSVTDREMAKSARAALDEVTRSGIAFDHEEVSAGLCCAAAPVITRPGSITGALSVSVPASRPLSPLANQVRAAARALSRLPGIVSP